MSSTTSTASDTDQFRRDDGPERAANAAIQSAGYFRWKIILDAAIASLLLIPACAVIVPLMLLVRITSPGPGIYRQRRAGRNGGSFTIYKIRTMRVDAETASGPVWTQPRDARITFVGSILRKMHLDELPQIFNVLRGQMSFVGPRPERPEFVRVLSEAVPRYRDRLVVRPGITGLAQINLPPDTDLTSVRRKVALDLDYIERGSLWLDARLLLCTGLRLFKVHEGFLTWMLALRRPQLLATIEASDDWGPEEATPATILLQAAQASSNGEAHEVLRSLMAKKPH